MATENTTEKTPRLKKRDIMHMMLTTVELMKAQNEISLATAKAYRDEVRDIHHALNRVEVYLREYRELFQKILLALQAIELETAHPPRVMMPATDRELVAESFDLGTARTLLDCIERHMRNGLRHENYTMNNGEATIVLYALRQMIFSTGEG